MTNPIESIFAPIRLRTDAMKRLRAAEFATAVTHALVMKLSPSWRRLSGYRDLVEFTREAVARKRAERDNQSHHELHRANLHVLEMASARFRNARKKSALTRWHEGEFKVVSACEVLEAIGAYAATQNFVCAN